MSMSALLCDGCGNDCNRLLWRAPHLLCIDCVNGKSPTTNSMPSKGKFALPPLKGKQR